MSLITFRTCEKTRSIITYAGLFFLTMITFVTGNLLVEKGEEIRIFGWEGLLVVLLGFILIGFQKEAGFPELLERSISWKNRFFHPFLSGLLFAIADIVVFKLILHPEPYSEMPSFVQPFPYSLLFYTSGALYTEIIHRLLLLTILLNLVHRYLPSGHHIPCFWILAIVTSLYEPVQQLSRGSAWVILYSFITGFCFNLLQVVYYRKAGLLASLSARLGHYLLWHILLGIYIQYIEVSG